MKLNAKSWKPFPVVMFIVFGAFLTFYLSEQSEGIPSGQGDLMDTMQISKVGEKVKAPDFVLKNPEGKSFRLKDLRGNWIMLNFWATW